MYLFTWRYFEIFGVSESSKMSEGNESVLNKKTVTRRKGAKCAVPFCNNNKRDNPTRNFSTFPKDVERCRKWLEIVGNEELLYLPHNSLSKTRYVCSEHFSLEQYSQKGLSRKAVPDIVNSRVTPLSPDSVVKFPMSELVPNEAKRVETPISVINQSGKLCTHH